MSGAGAPVSDIKCNSECSSGRETPAALGADGPYGGIRDSGCSPYRSQKDRTEPVGAYKEQRGMEPGICTWGTCPGGDITDS